MQGMTLHIVCMLVYNISLCIHADPATHCQSLILKNYLKPIIRMAALTTAISPNASPYGRTCGISQSSTVRHHFSTDDFLD